MIRIRRSKKLLSAAAVALAVTLTACNDGGGGTANAAHDLGSSNGRKACYPGTPKHPLEKEVLVTTSGGSYTDAIKQAYFDAFEKKCGVKVVSLSDANLNISQQIQYAKSGQAPYDMANTQEPSDYATGVKENLYLKLPTGFWDRKKSSLYPGSYTDYGVWETVWSEAIIYNKKTFPNGVHSWADFFNTGKYPGPRTMADDPTMVVAALLADGVPASKIYPITRAKLDRAFAKLDTIKSSIALLWQSADSPIQGVANGEFSVGVGTTGRAGMAIKNGLPIGIAWTGNLLYQNWWTVLKNAKHPRAAEALMYFMQDPTYQAKFANLFEYSGAPKGVASRLSKSVAANLPSTTAHMKVASKVDSGWWAKNMVSVQAAWDDWKGKGGFAG